MHSKISVIYLSWVPYGIDLLKQFIQSYQTFTANTPHQLVIVFNGVKNETDYTPFLNFATATLQKDVKYLVMESGQDIAAYQYAASKVDTEYIFCFNSFSKILAPSWLYKYQQAFLQSNVGLVSATASCQSHINNVFETHAIAWEFTKPFLYNYNKYKLFIKTIGYWYFLFKPFPNAHLRTTAFMIKRAVFLSIKCKPLTSKFKAYLFESGRNGFTNQIIKKGLIPLLIDKDGNTCTIDKMHTSKTFWLQQQQNLMVADNQTEIYANALQQQKMIMSKKAWGKYA